MPRSRKRQRTFGFAWTRRQQWQPRTSRAGRKPNGARAGVWHVPRPTHDSRHPVHVVWRVVRDAPNLRGRRPLAAIEYAFQRGRERAGFRLCHYVVLGNHAHLVCEAIDRAALSRGLQGLAIRVAWWVNRVTGRRGKLFADRYFLRPLASPREVHHALSYVLLNERKHRLERGEAVRDGEFDRASSAPYFDGWIDPPRHLAHARASPPTVVPAATWLLRTGWRRHGQLSLAMRRD